MFCGVKAIIDFKISKIRKIGFSERGYRWVRLTVSRMDGANLRMSGTRCGESYSKGKADTALDLYRAS
jgi:hypothetical protein